MSELAETKFVGNFPRFGVAKVVALGRLQRPEHPERAAGKMRMNDDVLQGRYEGITSEYRHEPRNPRRRDELRPGRLRNRQPQRRHIGDRLIERARELGIGRRDLDDGLAPLLELIVEPGAARIHAARRRFRALLSVAQIVQQTCMPPRPRRGFDFQH